jgi:protein-S-isoprenylcysteine O-methyltransferase Ste14
MTPIIGRDLLHFAFAWLAASAFAASLGYFLYAYLFLFGPAPAGSSVLAPSLINLALFTVFALHHSVFARTSSKKRIGVLVPAPLERALYTLTASVLFVVVCRVWRPVDGVAWTMADGWRWAGLAVQAAGVVMTIVGARALDVRDLAGVRQVMPGPAQSLKTDGVYGFVRHPLYFAWMLLVFGAPDMTMTRLTFAVISTLYLAIAIPFEERSLIETFGRDYASYRRRVRWRMIPGIY